MKSDPAVISLGLFLGVIALYTAGVSPLASSLSKSRSALSENRTKLEAIDLGTRLRADAEKRIKGLESKMADCRREWISPMLDSYAMRAKALLETLAREAGLVGVTYTEGTFRALPVPRTGVPQMRTGRRSVRLRAQGDYAALASFILRAEAELPLMTVQALKILPAKSGSVEQQDIDLVLEWPCEGMVIK